MPEVSRFFGIIIRLFPDDHPPTHFHAKYGEFEAKVAIDTLEIVVGELPTPQLRMVQGWAAIHQEELRENWEIVQDHRCPLPIAPLQ